MAYLLSIADDGVIPGATDEERAQYMRYRSQFELQQYYSHIADFTPTTKFISLAKEQAVSLMKYLTGSEIDSNCQEVIRSLSDEIDLNMKQLDGCAFVRLGSRSPKDAVDKPGTIRSRIVQHLAENTRMKSDFLMIQNAIDSPKTRQLANGIIAELRQAFFNSSSCSSAKETMEIFSNSSRIVSDLRRSLKSNLPVYIAQRKFTQWSVSHEFRGFVSKEGNLRALSQYFCDAFFELLDSELCAESIKKFYLSKIAPLKLEQTLGPYIIDFACQTDGNVIVVELNPFCRTTGSCLFSWEELDKSIDSPIETEVRVLKAPPSGSLVLLKEWYPILQEAFVSEHAADSCCMIV